MPPKLRCPRPDMRLLLVLLAGLFATVAHADVQRDAVRAALEEHEAAAEALRAAAVKGDAADAESSEKKANAALAKARELFAGFSHRRGAEAELLQLYARVQSLSGAHDLAAETLEIVVAQQSGDPHAWNALAAEWLECGPTHEKRCMEALRTSLKLEGTGAAASRAKLLLGNLYYRQGLYLFAAEAYDEAVALDAANNIEALIRQAGMRARAGQVAEASAAMDTLGAAAAAYDTMTRVYLRECLAFFEESGQTFADTAANHAAFCRLLYRAGRAPEAVLAGYRAVRLDNADFATWNLMAAMQAQLGNIGGARQAYEKSLEANPDQPQVKAALERMPKE